jgi:fibronectin type 3 domain-containing protein
VYRGTAPGAERATAWKTGITKPLFTNTGLTNGTTYYYKVTAVNSAGESPMSAEVSVTPPVTAPAAPTNLAAAAGDKTATLTWTAPTGTVTSYNIYRATAVGGEGATPYKKGITTTSFQDTGLTDGATYYYKVAAVNSAGTSPLSEEVFTTPKNPAVSPPAAPTGLAATHSGTSATITWMAPSGTVTSYTVYRGTTPGGEKASPYKSGVTKPTFTNTGLTVGTTYYYKVTALNAGGESPKSAEISVTP